MGSVRTPAKSRQSQPRTSLESLEPRRHLASSMWLQDNIVYIAGDFYGPTTVRITPDLRRISVSGVSDTRVAQVVRQLGGRTPTMIRIRGGRFSDKFIVEPGVRIPVHMDGGTGKNILVGGSGNDTLIGDGSHDRIITGGGNDYVLAGGGNDTVWGDRDDTVWGDNGLDVLNGVNDADNLAYPPAVGRSPLVPGEFKLSASGGSLGVSIYSLTVADVLAGSGASATLGPERNLTVRKISQTTLGNTVAQLWSTADGLITIQFVMIDSTMASNIAMTLTNRSAARITQIHLDMPWILTDASPDHAIKSTFKGGADRPWTNGGILQGSDATWPGYAYSPFAVFYNRRTGEGVSFTAFNDELDLTQISWTLDTDRATPSVHFWPNLDQAGSSTYEMELYHSWNMPEAQYSHYRTRFLERFMARKGIPEAIYRKQGVWGYADWVNYNETLEQVVQNAMNYGASGFVMWSPGDGLTPHYEPFHPGFPWASSLLSTSRLPGLQGLGVLINPYISLRIQNPDGTWRNDLRYLDDPQHRAWLTAQRDDMVARGVNFAYWDTGGTPAQGSGLDWLDVLWSFKRVGITVAPEQSADVAVWVTGANLHWPYSWGDYVVAKAVTPNATQFAVGNTTEMRIINGREMRWWEHATYHGMVPILRQLQLQERWELLGN
ncbi:calcium-binding protein [Fontivita pretiosa]|uniref:calcium-binding protein n=1 Tax=Fontivita pretiosa TaxID=2989684 RepID=UPI003D16325D